MLFRKKRIKNLVAKVKELTKDTYVFAKTQEKGQYIIECPLGYEESVKALIKQCRVKVVSQYYFYNRSGFLIK